MGSATILGGVMHSNGPIPCNNCPFVKGTSDEKVIKGVQHRLIISVLEKECLPIETFVRFGRSNQSIIYHHTIQTQTCCFIEWIISCIECS